MRPPRKHNVWVVSNKKNSGGLRSCEETHYTESYQFHCHHDVLLKTSNEMDNDVWSLTFWIPNRTIEQISFANHNKMPPSLSFFFFLWVLCPVYADQLNDPVSIARACSVFCHGPILAAIQTASPQFFNDSKTFVDMPLAVNPEVALAAFNANFTHEELQVFLEANFLPVGSDLVASEPKDWNVEPPFLDRITNETWRNFAKDLNSIWPELYREVAPAVFEQPQRFSLLRRRNGLVLPGGRFRETYYW